MTKGWHTPRGFRNLSWWLKCGRCRYSSWRRIMADFSVWSVWRAAGWPTVTWPPTNKVLTLETRRDVKPTWCPSHLIFIHPASWLALIVFHVTVRKSACLTFLAVLPPQTTGFLNVNNAPMQSVLLFFLLFSPRNSVLLFPNFCFSVFTS